MLISLAQKVEIKFKQLPPAFTIVTEAEAQTDIAA